MTVMTKELYKPYIEAVKPYEPGKPIKELEREMGLRNIVKLASNENPLGPSRKALRAMRYALQECHLYPEGSCHYLAARLAKELQVDMDRIIVGNGSNEIIELLVRGFVSPGDQVLSSDCSFLVYPILTQVAGGDYVSVPMKDYRYDLKGLLSAITDKTKLIFIANPNNPTGTYVSAREVEEFVAQVPKDVLICFDEAYVDFVEARDFPKTLDFIHRNYPNVIILRTFSKSYGLAGLRVGYGVMSKQLTCYLHKIRQPFNVNLLAQAGATAALDDRFFLWRTKHLVSRGRKYLYKRFDRLKLRYLPSEANFVLVDVGCDGQKVFEALLKKGMIVRSMKAYGLATWIRVTVGRRSQNAQFYRLLKNYLEKGA